MTGTIKESNVGGTPGKKFGTLGIGGLIVEGQPKPGQWFIVVVDHNGCRLESAAPFLGLGNYELVERLRASYGKNVGIVGATMGTIEYLEKLINAQFGVALTVVDLLELSRETIRIERAFNKAAGFTAADDRLPSFFRNERLLPDEVAFDVPQEEIDRTLRMP